MTIIASHGAVLRQGCVWQLSIRHGYNAGQSQRLKATGTHAASQIKVSSRTGFSSLGYIWCHEEEELPGSSMPSSICGSNSSPLFSSLVSPTSSPTSPKHCMHTVLAQK